MDNELESLLIDICQLIDSHGTVPHELTDWDKQVRQRISDYRASSCQPHIIGQSDKREFLVMLSDEELKIVTEVELQEWIKTDEEFDGFHGWRMMGEIIPADLTVR